MKAIGGKTLCIGMVMMLAAGPVMGGTILAPSENWLQNRFADFMDIFAIGGGLTFENQIGGPIPPSIGVYLEATTLLNLGVITHNGGTIEWEGRGAGIYTESRTLYGIGPYRGWRIYQGQYNGEGFEKVNYFKDEVRSQAWVDRMENDLRSTALTKVNRWITSSEYGSYADVTELAGDPAKKLIHKDTTMHRTFFGLPRGWQMWEYIGGEIAICEPFLTHMGVTVRAGIDPSEIMDFLLGIFFVDFKQDDRRPGE